MERLAVSQQAQKALCKFLLKLNLIKASDIPQTDVFVDQCAITYLATLGKVDEELAISKIAEQLQLNQHPLRPEEVDKVGLLLSDNVLRAIDIDRWISLRAAPIALHNTHVEVVMANPLDFDGRSALEFDIGRTVRVSIGREGEVLALLRKLRSAMGGRSVEGLLKPESKPRPVTPKHVPQKEADSEVPIEDVEAAPVVKVVNKIFYDSVHNGASDIHLSPERDGLQVKIRVDGMLRDLYAVPAKVQNAVVSRVKLLAGMDISERRKPQDGRIRITTGYGVKDLRVSTIPALHGEKVVARILSSEMKNMSLEALGMPAALIEKMSRALSGSSHVVIVCGPTGSGKTSTLYAGLQRLNNGKSNIITVEDPIEYRMSGITQVQINPKIGMTFAEGLRSILRQDPDVIMVGEIRDGETAEIAMQSAQTGHLVLSTLHTNSAPAAITRLVDLGMPSFLIASSVGSIIAQRLVRVLCKECSKPMSGPEAERFERLGINLSHARAAQGCPSCAHTGFKGRMGLYSFLEVNDDVRACIREGVNEDKLMQAARPRGFSTLAEEALVLINDGQTSLAEVERVLGPLTGQISNSVKHHQVSNGQSTHTSGSISKRRVLLVEDDENLRAILAAVLEREMFEVEQASDGRKALELIYKCKPEVVVSDLMMPGMDGLELVERLRRDPNTANIPVLMLTAVDCEENELKLISRGADDFVSKTSSSSVMVARVHRLLNR